MMFVLYQILVFIVRDEDQAFMLSDRKDMLLLGWI